MSDAILEQKIAMLPQKYLAWLSQYVDFLIYEFNKEQDEIEELNAETQAALREVEEMKNNPNIGKSYTDVDEMMRELLA